MVVILLKESWFIMSEGQKDLSKNNHKKSGKGYLILTFLLLVFGVLGFLFIGQQRTVAVPDDASALEAHIVEEYSAHDHIQSIEYGHRNTSREGVYVTDFSDPEVSVDGYEMENYAGTVEFNETFHSYVFANGRLSDDAPRQESITRRVQILPMNTPNLPDLYSDVYYSNHVIDVDLNYFIGNYDHAIVRLFNDSEDIATTIRYVIPDSYQYVVAETTHAIVQNQGGTVDVESIEIDGTEYFKYTSSGANDLE